VALGAPLGLGDAVAECTRPAGAVVDRVELAAAVAADHQARQGADARLAADADMATTAVAVLARSASPSARPE
jgi:hypothetical protein